jgi:uncharacterized protein YegP (UPF0339 family)
MTQPRFTLKRATNGEFYWNLLAANSEVILTSQRYRMRGTALSGILCVKDLAPHDEHFDRLPSGDQFYFNLRAANGQIIGTSERYTTRAARERGIAAVRQCAAEAVIDE